MKSKSNATTKAPTPTTTAIGEALDQLSDHRHRADQVAEIRFCPSLKPGQSFRHLTVR